MSDVDIMDQLLKEIDRLRAEAYKVQNQQQEDCAIATLKIKRNSEDVIEQVPINKVSVQDNDDEMSSLLLEIDRLRAEINGNGNPQE